MGGLAGWVALALGPSVEPAAPLREPPPPIAIVADDEPEEIDPSEDEDDELPTAQAAPTRAAAPPQPRPREAGAWALEREDGFGSYTRFSLGLGAASLIFDRCSIQSGWLDSCTVSPDVRVTWEVGKWPFTLLAELETAPMPFIQDGIPYFVEAICASTGGTLGGHKVRASVTAQIGYLCLAVEARFTATPWRDRRGHRHGFELSAGVRGGDTLGRFVVVYRFVPDFGWWRARRARFR